MNHDGSATESVLYHEMIILALLTSTPRGAMALNQSVNICRYTITKLIWDALNSLAQAHNQYNLV